MPPFFLEFFLGFLGYASPLGHRPYNYHFSSMYFALWSEKRVFSSPIWLITLLPALCLTLNKLECGVYKKKSNFAKWFFDIFHLEKEQCRQKSSNLYFQSQFSMSKNVQLFPIFFFIQVILYVFCKNCGSELMLFNDWITSIQTTVFARHTY